MGAIKGHREFRKWKRGESLTRKEAMLAHCFVCNGELESATDCLSQKSCPMYAYSPYRDVWRNVKKALSEKN